MVSLNAIPHVRRVKLIAAVGHDARKRHRMLAFAGMGVMLLALGLVGGPALKRRRRLAGLYPDDALFAEPVRGRHITSLTRGATSQHARARCHAATRAEQAGDGSEAPLRSWPVLPFTV
jgi:hypothetical protein